MNDEESRRFNRLAVALTRTEKERDALRAALEKIKLDYCYEVVTDALAKGGE